ncbi:8826_t:CDS:1, partial [Funneliformis caledonium]
KTSRYDTMKLEFVKRHKNSVEYKNSLQILNLSQTGIKEDVNQILEIGMDSVVTQMRNIYFLTLQNIAINIYPDLTNLVNYQKEHPTSMVNDIPLQVL